MMVLVPGGALRERPRRPRLSSARSRVVPRPGMKKNKFKNLRIKYRGAEVKPQPIPLTNFPQDAGGQLRP